MAKVVIIGAGLTGLSVALELEKSGFYDYKIFEKNPKPGGLLQSFKQDGFTFDYTGHLLHVKSNYFYSFLTNIVGINNLLKKQRKAAIQTHNKLIEYPFQMNLYGLPKSIIHECVETFLNRNSDNSHLETFYDWVLKYFGEGIGKHFLFPYNSKLLAYNAKKLHHSWTSRFVPKITTKEIIDGALLKNKRRSVGYNNFFYYPKKDGIEFVIQQICKHLRNPILTNQNVISVEQKNKKIVLQSGKEESFDYLVTTAPLDVFISKLKETSDTSFFEAEKKLLCNSVINFNIGFNTDKISKNHWLYFPEKEYQFYRIGFWNNINSNSAPKHCSSIYGELSYLPKTTKNIFLKEKTENATNQSLEYLNKTNKNILTKKILNIDHAYVIYDAWREHNIKKLLLELEQKKIFSTGRFGAWKYSSMEESIIDGNVASQKILIDLKKNVKKEQVNQLT